MNDLLAQRGDPGSSPHGASLRIRVLYVEGCPNVDETVRLVRRLAGSPPWKAVIEEIAVVSQSDAVRHRFLGSPTVQVNGVDVDPAARDRTDFALSCRLYGKSGVPEAEMIVSALREAAGVKANAGAVTKRVSP